MHRATHAPSRDCSLSGLNVTLAICAGVLGYGWRCTSLTRLLPAAGACNDTVRSRLRSELASRAGRRAQGPAVHPLPFGLGGRASRILSLFQVPTWSWLGRGAPLPMLRRTRWWAGTRCAQQVCSGRSVARTPIFHLRVSHYRCSSIAIPSTYNPHSLSAQPHSCSLLTPDATQPGQKASVQDRGNFAHGAYGQLGAPAWWVVAWRSCGASTHGRAPPHDDGRYMRYCRQRSFGAPAFPGLPGRSHAPNR